MTKFSKDHRKKQIQQKKEHQKIQIFWSSNNSDTNPKHPQHFPANQPSILQMDQKITD